MDIIDKLLKYKFRSSAVTNVQSASEQSASEQSAFEQSTSDQSASVHHAVLLQFFKSLSEIDKDYNQEIITDEDYCRNCTKLYQEFIKEMDDYETVLSLDDDFSSQYHYIRLFADKIIKNACLKKSKGKDEGSKGKDEGSKGKDEGSKGKDEGSKRQKKSPAKLQD